MFAEIVTEASAGGGLDPAWVGLFYLFGRFFLAVVLACGGIYALKKGFELIVTHVGRRKEEAEIKFWKLEANVRTVGSVVMVTACIWGYLGYLSLPTSTEFAGLKVAGNDLGIEDGGEAPNVQRPHGSLFGQDFEYLQNYPYYFSGALSATFVLSLFYLIRRMHQNDSAVGLGKRFDLANAKRKLLDQQIESARRLTRAAAKNPDVPESKKPSDSGSQ